MLTLSETDEGINVGIAQSVLLLAEQGLDLHLSGLRLGQRNVLTPDEPPPRGFINDPG